MIISIEYGDLNVQNGLRPGRPGFSGGIVAVEQTKKSILTLEGGHLAIFLLNNKIIYVKRGPFFIFIIFPKNYI